MELKIDIEKMAKEVAEKVMDNTDYDGKTIREWVDLIKGFTKILNDWKAADHPELCKDFYFDKIVATMNKADMDVVNVTRCKDCKYFEYDHVENVAGVPLIVAHEICTRISDGIKTAEDGFCFLGEKRAEGDPVK